MIKRITRKISDSRIFDWFMSALLFGSLVFFIVYVAYCRIFAEQTIG